MHRLCKAETTVQFCLGALYARIATMYEDLTTFERQLAHFGDRVQVIVGLEVGGKLHADEAYKQIKDLVKDLKKLRKSELKHGNDLDNSNFGFK